MLSKATAQLVEEVFASLGEKAKRKAQEEPETCLISILLVIKERLSDVSASLDNTIEKAPYDHYLNEAREKLRQTA